MNIRLNRLDARQRLAILNAKCNLCNKNVIVFSLPIVSMWSDKDAGRPMHPRTYMMSHITRAAKMAASHGRRAALSLPGVHGAPCWEGMERAGSAGGGSAHTSETTAHGVGEKPARSRVAHAGRESMRGVRWKRERENRRSRGKAMSRAIVCALWERDCVRAER